ncbi:hypothetical protein VST7929_01376 [Vibrio stylophorae]|uniref:DUF4401 domain-containing protein n=1 Tax=Vibrio stylophorae TaxID=659351 RepID=A0ABN8DQR0_9VIBR|nr:hypothetical protein [Vibrio stylophorae]CAH0533506.1 hypothetical protein VST7929_01376 [Vibrio stylophorae]
MTKSAAFNLSHVAVGRTKVLHYCALVTLAMMLCFFVLSTLQTSWLNGWSMLGYGLQLASVAIYAILLRKEPRQLTAISLILGLLPVLGIAAISKFDRATRQMKRQQSGEAAFLPVPQARSPRMIHALTFLLTAGLIWGQSMPAKAWYVVDQGRGHVEADSHALLGYQFSTPLEVRLEFDTESNQSLVVYWLSELEFFCIFTDQVPLEQECASDADPSRYLNQHELMLDGQNQAVIELDAGSYVFYISSEEVGRPMILSYRILTRG